MFSAGPRMVLPRGLCWNAVACKWSKITSSATPSTYSDEDTGESQQSTCVKSSIQEAKKVRVFESTRC